MLCRVVVWVMYAVGTSDGGSGGSGGGNILGQLMSDAGCEHSARSISLSLVSPGKLQI